MVDFSTVDLFQFSKVKAVFILTHVGRCVLLDSLRLKTTLVCCFIELKGFRLEVNASRLTSGLECNGFIKPVNVCTKWTLAVTVFRDTALYLLCDEEDDDNMTAGIKGQFTTRTT